MYERLFDIVATTRKRGKAEPQEARMIGKLKSEQPECRNG
jgi:hypothetical protein